MDMTLKYWEAERTVELLRASLLGLDFHIVGSYSRHKLDGVHAEDPFNVMSDIDLALQYASLPEAATRLENISLHLNKSFQTMRTNDYNGQFFPPPPENLVVIGGLTPIHLVGSLNNKSLEYFSLIDGLKFRISKPGLY